jgi:ABC-type branched-subunit amino acid transport system substrate-binding protein
MTSILTARRWVAVLGLSLFLGALPVFPDLPAYAQATGKVRIDVNLPLTGPQAVTASPYINGLLMGFDDGSKEQGVGRDAFELDIQSNDGAPKQAVSVLQKQLTGKFDVYISGFSSPARAVAPEIDKLDVAHVILAFDAFITAGSKNRLRLSPHYKLEGPLLVEYAKQQGAKRVAILSLNLASMFEEYTKLVEPELAKAGIVSMREVYDFGTTEYGPIALKAAEFKPDLVMVSGFSTSIYPMVKALRALDLIKDGNVICAMDFIDLLHNNTPREELAGIAYVAPYFDLPGVVAGAADWIARYKQRFDGKEPSYIGAYGYDTARIIVTAYKKAGVVTTDSIRGVLPYNGVTGTVTIDDDGDLASTLGIAKIGKSGDIEIVRK